MRGGQQSPRQPQSDASVQIVWRARMQQVAWCTEPGQVASTEEQCGGYGHGPHPILKVGQLSHVTWW